MDFITSVFAGVSSFMLLVAVLEIRHTKMRRARIADYYRNK